MPWREETLMSQRREFVGFANQADRTMSLLCRRFGISRKTGYKWLGRFRERGVEGLKDLSRRPHHSPRRTSDDMEQRIVHLRQAHFIWGGRKLNAVLKQNGKQQIPAPSTITNILHRHSLINPEQSAAHIPYRRFEHPEPNDLWQMDFKGEFRTGNGYCYPLTVLDDHSRFALCLKACPDQRADTVKEALCVVFRLYGLPWRMTMDNGAPWRGNAPARWSRLTIWLIRLGITVSHSRPFHPQTQGKDERFHRTLKAEVLRDFAWRDLAHCQLAFDPWRDCYNCERPHEALQMDVPASRYSPSVRPFTESLPPIEYPSDSIIRKVLGKGQIRFKGRTVFLSEALCGLHVAIRPTQHDGNFDVYFCAQKLTTIDLKYVRSSVEGRRASH